MDVMSPPPEKFITSTAPMKEKPLTVAAGTAANPIGLAVGTTMLEVGPVQVYVSDRRLPGRIHGKDGVGARIEGGRDVPGSAKSPSVPESFRLREGRDARERVVSSRQ